MNELDYIRTLRADVPEPADGRLAAGRARLTAAIATRVRAAGGRSLRGARDRRLAPALAALCALAAAAGAVAVASAVTGRDAVSRSDSSRIAAIRPIPVTLTARVLRTAAAVAARGRAAEPRPGQWFFSETVDYEFSLTPATTAYSEWETFDGRYTAYYAGGQLIVHQSPAPVPPARGTALDQFDSDATPLTAYRALASLPSSPRALLAVIAAQVARDGAGNVMPGSPLGQAVGSHRQADFAYLVQLVWNAAAGEPPAAQASVFEAMAMLPGVSVQEGITDAAGRPAIAVSDDGGFDQLLLSPRSYAVVGIRQLSTGVGPVKVRTKGQLFATLLAGLKGARLRAMKAEIRARGNLMWLKAKAQAQAEAVKWPPRGAVVESLAISRLDAVPGPGIR
jgi:hypothetical protein